MRRGVVCGARAGVEEALGTAGVIRGGAMDAVDSGGGTVNAGDGPGGGAGCRGRAEGEAWTGGGVDIAGAVARVVGAGFGDATVDGAGVEITAGVVRAIGVDVGMAETGAFGVGTGLALTGVAVVVVGVELLEGRRGVTNVFEGASGGGVDSAFIFARARSAAGRSVSVDQLFSTVAWVRFSFILCGRFIPWSVVRAGADITRISPRTVGAAVVSEFTCRSRRYRSIGCRLRERISS